MEQAAFCCCVTIQLALKAFVLSQVFGAASGGPLLTQVELFAVACCWRLGSRGRMNIQSSVPNLGRCCNSNGCTGIPVWWVNGLLAAKADHSVGPFCGSCALLGS